MKLLKLFLAILFFGFVGWAHQVHQIALGIAFLVLLGGAIIWVLRGEPGA
jgi:hypothetical protein